MTIEEEFFKTFGIEPKIEYYCPKCKHLMEDWWYGEKEPEYKCSNSLCDYETDVYCDDFKDLIKNEQYPEITAERLLELIRIMNIYQEKSLVYGQTKRELQEDILNRVMLMHKKGLGIKREVREVFEGDNENP